MLTDARLDAGLHTLSLDASRIAPGVYVIRLVTLEQTLVRHLTVVR